jgi:hypothetical protein
MSIKRYHLKRISLTFTLLLLIVLGINGCTKPVAVEFGKVCQKENDDKYISVEGYLRTGASVLCSSRSGTRTCGLELSDKPDGQAKISVDVEEGTGKSQMEPLPKSYSKENLKVHTQDGSAVGPQDRVRITGTAKTATDAVNSSITVCYLTADKIEKL